MKLAMLLLAAGRGSRFGGEVPKVYLPLCGRPVLLRSAERLVEVARPGAAAELIVVVSPADRQRHLEPLVPALAALGARVVDGGETRQESMRRGLAAAAPDCGVVLIHDAARPLFDPVAARRCVERAAEVGAALLAAPVTDTLKRADASRLVHGTVDRRDLWAAQTPQAVQRGLLIAALDHAECHRLEATDDVALVEAMGGKVAIVASTQRNLKITHQQDLDLAAALLGMEPSP